MMPPYLAFKTTPTTSKGPSVCSSDRCRSRGLRCGQKRFASVLAQEPGIAAEAPLPQAVAHHGHRLAGVVVRRTVVRRTVFRREEAPSRGPDAEHGKVVGGHRQSVDALAGTVLGQAELEGAEGGQAGKRVGLREVEVVGVREIA